MFSKALFKQSCKANGIMWAIITFAVCFMLACVMAISGSGNITKLKEGLSDTIVESSIEANMQERALNYYLLNNKFLTQYDADFLAAKTQGLDDQSAGMAAFGNLANALEIYIQEKGYDNNSIEAEEIYGSVLAVLNPQGMFDDFYAACGETAPVYDMSTLGQDGRATYINEYIQKYYSIFLAANMVSDENIDALVENLKDFGIDHEKYASFTYETMINGEVKNVSRYVGESGFKYIEKLSNTAIVTFQARLEFEMSQGVEKETAVTKILGDITETLLSSLPEDVASSLKELGETDLYSMIVGSIFFKMAGLLLPIIYMIMAANNLIAGQVDSGSMAYVLSTSTKRRTVVFTQAVFLVGSLFAMFCCTTITSVICMALLDVTTSLTMSHLVLLNLGAFLAMFAMSGISFLASCWFNRSKYSMSIGGGLNMFFLVATMLGLFGSKVLPSVIRLDALNFFNYVSLISLFDVTSILDGGLSFIWKLAILLVFGIACYFIGARKFIKKDLPL